MGIAAPVQSTASSTAQGGGGGTAAGEAETADGGVSNPDASREGAGAEEGDGHDDEGMIGIGSREEDRSALADDRAAQPRSKSRRSADSFARTAGGQGDAVSTAGVELSMRHTASAIDRMHCPGIKDRQPRRTFFSVEVNQVPSISILGGRPNNNTHREKTAINVVVGSSNGEFTEGGLDAPHECILQQCRDKSQV